MNEQTDTTNKAASAKPQLPNSKAKVKTPSGSSKKPFNILGIICLSAIIVSSVFFQYRVELLSAKNSALEKHLNLLSEQNLHQSQQSGELTEQLAQGKTQLSSMTGRLAFMQNTLNQIPGARLEDWKLAETEYLLRLANQRVQLQKEVSGAAALLDAANQILASLDDPALLVVRENISKEMLMLGHAQEIDTHGIYSKIQALKTLVHNDIQPPTTFVQAQQSTPDEMAKVEGPQTEQHSRLIQQLFSLVSIRTRENAFDAPLATEQYQLLEHSLLLMLEQAQWALLKGDQILYEASLGNAQTWIKNKLRHKQADNLLNNITDLKSLTVAVELPDISASLRVLRQILNDRTYMPSPEQLKAPQPKEPNTPVEQSPAETKKDKMKQEQA